MTLKEFIDDCAADQFPVNVKEDKGDKFRFVIGASRLEDLRDRNVAAREIEAFTIDCKANGDLLWTIIVKEIRK